MERNLSGESYDPNIVNDDFPMEETFECWDGTERIFIISCRMFPGMGFEVEAVEKGKNRLGYELAAHHPISPYSALGDLRKKMYRALARRHITKRDRTSNFEGYLPLHDTIEGRITSDERGAPAFVVDGNALSYEELLQMFEMHGGWQFRLSFAELSDDFP